MSDPNKPKKKTFAKIMASPYTTLAGIIISLLGLILPLFKINPIAIYCILGGLGLYFIVITAYFIKLYFSAYKIKKNLVKRSTLAFENMRKEMWVNIADVLDAADDVSAQLQKEVCSDNSFTNAMERVCQPIKKILDLSLKDCAVCIKRICTDEVMNDKYDTWETITLARVCSNRAERSQDDLQTQKISDNTSFYEILSKHETMWSSNNLDDTAQAYRDLGLEYKNPDARYHDYYRSTIVVPIFRKVERVSPIIKEYKANLQVKGKHYLGFLCVDSMNTFPKDNTNFKEAMRITRIFGRFLYPLLERRLVQQLENKNKPNDKQAA